jgi:acyl dehydratase
MKENELESLRRRAIPIWHGRGFEEFEVGQVYTHHWGRTLIESDNILFTTLTLSYNPLYFNVEYARKLGHDSLVINPMLVFLTTIGLSVEDLSEGGQRGAHGLAGSGGEWVGGFLGVDELTFHTAVYPGDTLFARSEVTMIRRSRSRPSYGIVAWHTEGYNQHGARVIDFIRSNMMAAPAAGSDEREV